MSAAAEPRAAAPPDEPGMLKVYQPWHAPPVVRVPWDRVDEVRQALEAVGFPNWVGETGSFANLAPWATVVLRWEADQDAAQRVLDELVR
ncbi:hypothetical protein [Alienimonas sp. DA493]|uniref:hypothetical protein n=1 Tax=Alienimonas sp. DA493 TaxID=3373605 RepID=UPI0037550604